MSLPHEGLYDCGAAKNGARDVSMRRVIRSAAIFLLSIFCKSGAVGARRSGGGFFCHEGVGVGGECRCEVVCDSANFEDFFSGGAGCWWIFANIVVVL